MTIGRYLAQARELRGVALAEVAERTKIPRATLEALEGDERERLPGRVYVQRYLRAYAEAVGLDPDEVLLRYEEVTGPPEDDPNPELPPPVARRAPPWALIAALAALLAALALSYWGK